ncbi:hypothetical protein Vadar_033426 [Vaccinium darrowii]|uniref:Uncharacterized protein n=1 Tax=Vaccinium darrowii TaxID=229202 RepID=A0ACB7YBL9_9ERIC|nr:hypothetical protein Vadar_033426 [Vaccinium darrowii]
MEKKKKKKNLQVSQNVKRLESGNTTTRSLFSHSAVKCRCAIVSMIPMYRCNASGLKKFGSIFLILMASSFDYRIWCGSHVGSVSEHVGDTCGRLT